MTVFSCRPEFEAMMTCIYEAWSSGLGHKNIRLEAEPIYQPELMTTYIHVEADSVKSDKVIRAIRDKISFQAYLWVYYASLSYEEDALDSIYRFLLLGFHYGEEITRALQNPYVMRVMELRRNTGNEAHLSREFLRFNSIDNHVYAAHFMPKNNVILSVANHFQDRMNSEHWIIVDDGRRIAAIHPCNQDFYIRDLTEDEFLRLGETNTRSDYFNSLWKMYFNTIAIKERENYECQRNHFPIWMRKYAVEFNQI